MRRWLLIALLVVGVAGYFGLGRTLWPPGPPSGARAVTAAIPVAVGAVQRADVPIFLAGLGTVQAFYTVTVTARVDGELQKIAFTEGQTAHKGDLLAQIDPRPNQAAYAQAVAAKAKDARAAASDCRCRRWN